MKKCPNCNHLNPDTAKTCLECSMPLGGAVSSNLRRTEPYTPPPTYGNSRFDASNQRISQNIYKDEVKSYLHAKDGKIHVLMINSFSKWLNQVFGVESKYTVQLDNIVSSMQEDGYEIVDIKFSTEQNQGLFKEMEGFYTLIIYK